MLGGCKGVLLQVPCSTRIIARKSECLMCIFHRFVLGCLRLLAASADEWREGRGRRHLVRSEPPEDIVVFSLISCCVSGTGAGETEHAISYAYHLQATWCNLIAVVDIRHKPLRVRKPSQVSQGCPMDGRDGTSMSARRYVVDVYVWTCR